MKTEKRIQYEKKYYLKNQEKKKKYQKNYYQKNIKIELKYANEYRLKNPKYQINYHLKNPEYTNNYYQKNRKKLLNYQLNYHLKNPEYRKNYKKENPKIFLKIQIKQLIKIGKQLKLPYKEYSWALQSWTKIVKKQQGGQCVVCGSKNKLNIHHILHKSKHPRLSLNPNNGVPLCIIHHQEVHGNKLRGVQK